MNQFLNKILRTASPRFFSNGTLFFADFQEINRLFSRNLDLPKTENEQHENILKLFRQITSSTNTSLQFYFQNREEKNVWYDGNGARITSGSLAEYLTHNFEIIFDHEIQVHSAPMPLSRKMLTFRLARKYYYVIDISDKKSADTYFDFLFTLTSSFLKSLKSVRDKFRLNSRIMNLQNELVAKEKSLMVAERAVKRKVYDLHNLVEASNEIYSILNFKQLINSALLTIIGQLGIQHAFALMFDNSRHTFSRNFQKGFRENEIAPLKFKGESPIARYFMNHPIPSYCDEMSTNAELRAYRDKLKKLNIRIVAPIIYAERLQGMIGIGGKLYEKDFTQTDFELFHVLINIISISIENTLHYEEVKNLSLTDGMTNLHNYRYFSIRLKEELNRAKRNKTKVSLLILDIDYFKNYNDTLGHQAGDEALRTLGRVLKNTVRDEDVVSRYGGEEFCIILPGISKSDMQPLGERVRNIIELHQFYKERVQPSGRMTISLGGSTYPDDAHDADELIQKADQALYKAKNFGRNQLVIYEKPKTLKKKADVG